ncbi:DUF4083 family protein [Pseudalkalibacillus salsuginis]|uniref:DUF4083 family protein n=1 Tax=Pseudalkalibacillus salsuginis TaxID=2910972 RepID=UPI001F30B246|nr:DUF4083 family protein [Pseudalkalibacillus salsuginis]MCF6410186.1 DUF4083 family protein [Pseudalkalibacillus salsuginis]
MDMYIGDIVYQLLAFLMVLSIISGIVFLFTYIRYKKNRLKEIERKLDHVIQKIDKR